MLLNTAKQETRTPGRSQGVCEDAPVYREGHRSRDSSKEGSVHNTEHWHDERPVEVVIAHFTRSLCDQSATVAGRAV
jgi:hypothetical protein